MEVPNVDWVEPLAMQDESMIARWRERAWTRTVEFIRKEIDRKPIHLFLGYLYPRMVEPSAIQEIKDLGIPCVNFFCDNVREFRKVPPEYRCFDLHWVPEYQALAMYRKAGLQHIHAAMPCWIPPEHRTIDHSEAEGVTFVGSSDLLRRHLLGTAVELGADIRIFGPGWSGEPKTREFGLGGEKKLARLLKNQWHCIRRNGLIAFLLKFEPHFRPLLPPPIPPERLMGGVWGEKYLQVIRESAITIGINRVQTSWRSVHKPITYSRLRDIEAPMMGCCYLTEWAEDLEHLYDIGSEIETYRTADELRNKLERPAERPRNAPSHEAAWAASR